METAALLVIPAKYGDSAFNSGAVDQPDAVSRLDDELSALSPKSVFLHG
jgi:hypothetical protein